jgi:hypothetical protein
MITLQNLTYSYDGRSKEALHDISGQIPPGVHLLMGANGAGKTTLLKNLGGVLMPSSGRCLLDNRNISLREPSVLSKITFLGNDFTTFMRDVREMARRHACFFPGFDPAKLERNLSEFGLNCDMKFSSMSLGTRHKAMLAYVMSLNTEVLLLDEPANGLDIGSKETLSRMLAEMSSPGTTIIVSTHTIADLASLYDGVIHLHHGEVALAGAVEDILSIVTFKSGYSQLPGALYSEWYAGKYRHILPFDEAGPCFQEQGIFDYRLLYSALESPQGGIVAQYIRNALLKKNYDTTY